MTRQEYRRIYTPLLDDVDQHVEASFQFSRAEAPVTVDAEAFRQAVRATQERAAANLPPLTFDAKVAS
jgi:hypothetical protein